MRGVINLTAPSDRSQALRQAARRWCVHAQETGQSPHTFNPMTSIKSLATAAASVAAGATVLAFSGPAAKAGVYDSFGWQGGCDSGNLSAWGNGAGFNYSQRDCEKHRDWAAREAQRNRKHQTQGQLIEIGGGIITGLINSSQNRQQASSAELALQRQQQEIELLKLQLQQQQQQAAYGVQNVGNYGPVVQPAYPYGYQQQTGYYQHNQYGYNY
jgi:hypothetical protein